MFSIIEEGVDNGNSYCVIEYVNEGGDVVVEKVFDLEFV
jgi:hypothetical protein